MPNPQKMVNKMNDNDLAPEHRLAALQRAQDEVLRLESECARLRKDAERYRKLRCGCFVSAPMAVDPFNNDSVYAGAGLDAALDALPSASRRVPPTAEELDAHEK